MLGVSMFVSRRHVLQMLGSAAVVGVLSPLDVLADMGRTLVTPITPKTTAESEGICAINLQTLNASFIPLAFPAHSCIQNPAYPTHVWAVERWGTNAAEVDIQSGKVIRTMQSPKDTQFYGHGLFWHNLLLISSVNYVKKRGGLAGFDYTTLKHEIDFDATPGGLHQSHFTSSNKAVISSSGTLGDPGHNPILGQRLEGSSIVEVDLSANKITNKIAVPDADQIVSHLTVLKNGTIVALSTPRPLSFSKHGNIYFAAAGSALQKVPYSEELNQRLSGEILSVVADEDKGIAVITNPASETLMFLDTKQGKLTGWTKNDGCGIAFDPSLGFLSSGSGLAQVDPVARIAKHMPLSKPDAKSPVPLNAIYHSVII